MRLIIPILILSALALLASACRTGERLPEDLMTAEFLMDYSPADGDYQYASWCLLKSCADYKAYARTIDEESLKTGTDYLSVTETKTGKHSPTTSASLFILNTPSEKPPTTSKTS